MRLCFGVLATVLKHGTPESVSNTMLVSTLVGTIDPDNIYGDGDHDIPVSRLMNCSGSFPKSVRSQSYSVTRDESVTTTSVIPKSVGTDPDELSIKIESDIMPLINEDKKAAAIGILQLIISKDDLLKAENRKTFEKCMGMDLDETISPKLPVNFPRFLAGIFLYTLRTNKNRDEEGKATVDMINKEGFFDSFSDYLVTYTNAPIPTFTPAPDNCEEYLKRLKDKYDRVSTLVYKGVSRPFYDLYVPGALSLNGETIEDTGIKGILAIGKNIIFTGTGGQGKSMLMRHLLLDAISAYDETGLMPIFISVKDFDGLIPDILQCAHAFIRNLWPELSMDELQTMFIDGKVLLLFDGLDEIRPQLLSSFTSALNEFQDRYLNNAVILSSRPYDNFNSFSQCVPTKLEPFSKDQALRLVEKLNFPNSPEFKEKLENGLYEQHKGYSDNPLLLSIMLLTYDQFREIPSKVHAFYQQAYLVLAELHDKSKELERPLATGWSVDGFAEYFSYFCSITYQKALTSFSYDAISKFFGIVKKHYRLDVTASSFIKDVCGNICLMAYDGKTYDFIHRSFQEYFCARFLYHQDEKDLEKVIPLFDRREKTRDDDKTLMMLYDMEPEAVTNYMFVPFLKSVVDECETNEGVWTFVKMMYGELECADGLMKDKAKTAPDSRLYAYIADLYHLHPKAPQLDEYPVFDEFTLEVYKLEDARTWQLKRIRTYARELSKHSNIGRIYHFDWDKLKETEEGRRAVEKPDGPFVMEYEAVKKVYRDLSEKVSEEHDFFTDMF